MMRRGSWFHAGLAGALLTQAALQLWFATSHSATFDEPSFLAAGMALWTTGRDTQVFIHPPLAKEVAGLAALLAGADPAGAPDDRDGTRTLYRVNGARADRILLAARAASIALALTLTAVAAMTARGWWGDGAGGLVAWLLALEPTTLAHGALATTDVSLTLWLLLFTRACWTFLAEPAGRDRFARLRCGLWGGLAVGTKFSALGFLPAVAVALAAARARDESSPAPFRRLVRAAPRMGAALAATVFAVFAVHPRVFEPGYGGAGPWSWWPVTLAGLPNVYFTFGVRWALLASRIGAPTFFLGALRTGALPAYFPVAFLLKVPLALPLLALAGAAWRTRRAGGPGLSGPALAVALAGAGILAAVLTSRLHLGVRHVHPAIVFTALLGASVVGPGLARPRWRAALAALALAWELAGTARCAPHFLASFTELAGGPAGGWRCLADSNLDWGQDLPALAAWCRAHGVTRLPLAYFGAADPAAYGVPAVPFVETRSGAPRSGYVAVSVSLLDGVLTEDLERFGAWRARTPVARPGWSIHVYSVTDAPRGVATHASRGTH